MFTQLDLLQSTKFVTITNVNTNAAVSIEIFDERYDFAKEIIAEMGKRLKGTTTAILSPTVIIGELKDISRLFQAFVVEGKADYLIARAPDGSIFTKGSDWDRMFQPCPIKDSIARSLLHVAISYEDKESICKGDLSDPFFKKPDAEAKVLKALYTRIISQFEAAKLLLYINTKPRHIEVGSKSHPKLDEYIDTFFSHFGSKKQSKARELFGKLSEIDSQFIVIDGGEDLGSKKFKTIFQMIGHRVGKLCRIVDKKWQFLLPPPTLQMQILQALFGNKSMLANPVVGGLSDPIEFESPLHRPVLIPISKVPSPMRIHGSTSDESGAFVHDALGHLFLEARNWRIPLIRIAKLFAYNEELWKTLLDRNLPNLSTFTPSQNFWFKIGVAFSRKTDIEECEIAIAYRHIIREILSKEDLYKRYKIDPLSDKDIEAITSSKTFAKYEESLSLFFTQYKAVKYHRPLLYSQEMKKMAVEDQIEENMAKMEAIRNEKAVSKPTKARAFELTAQLKEKIAEYQDLLLKLDEISDAIVMPFAT